MKTINLTDEQAGKLEMYLMMSTGYRNREEEACKELGAELKPDGSLAYPNLKSNGEWWEKANEVIGEIIKLLY